jgi:hypothetical protein
MASQLLEPELERRVALLENVENQGAGFGQIDWFWLIALGIVFPALLLIWGWM